MSGSTAAITRSRRGEGHLDVDLRELRLAVGAQVLVAEALGDLEVAIDARDHQDLLEELRRLRQRVELAGVDAARHEVVARAFGRGLRQDRRLDLPEALAVEVRPDGHRHAVAQPQVGLQGRAAEIEVPVSQPQLVRGRHVVRDHEGRDLGLAEDLQLGGLHLDLPCRHAGVERRGRPWADPPLHAYDEFGSELLRAVTQRVGVEHDLRQAVPIADVEEHEVPEIADLVHPAQEHRLPPDVGSPQLAARVSPRPVSKLVRHGSLLPPAGPERPEMLDHARSRHPGLFTRRHVLHGHRS